VKRDTLAVALMVSAIIGCQAPTKTTESPPEPRNQEQVLSLTAGGFIENHPERGAVQGLCTADPTRTVLNCDIYNGISDWTLTEITLGVTWYPYDDEDKRYFHEKTSISPMTTAQVHIRLGLELPLDDSMKRKTGPPVNINHWAWLIVGAKGLHVTAAGSDW
jgi:hypothetical protein